MLRLSALLFALGLVLGCAPSPPPLVAAPPAKLPAGYTLKEVPKYGISIAVAPGWKPGSGEVADPKAMLTDIGGEVPTPGSNDDASGLGKMMRDEEARAQAAEAKAMAALEEKGIIIRVNDVNMKPVFGEDPTRYQVRIMPNPASSLEAAASSLLEHVPGEEKPVKITLPVGPAMWIRANKKMVDGGEVATSKYVLQDGKTMIVVSFVTEAEPGAIRNIEKTVMDTLRIVPGKATPPKEKEG